jgi:hypothetical protein
MLAGLQAYAWKDTFWKNYYSAMADAEDLTVLDALQYMIIRLQESSEKAKSPIPDPDDASHNYLPTDQVFEFGFDPLAGGFKAEGNGDFKIFDQWIEVLPTDQIVPVEVEYDPATGRLK